MRLRRNPTCCPKGTNCCRSGEALSRLKTAQKREGAHWGAETTAQHAGKNFSGQNHQSLRFLSRRVFFRSLLTAWSYESTSCCRPLPAGWLTVQAKQPHFSGCSKQHLSGTVDRIWYFSFKKNKLLGVVLLYRTWYFYLTNIINCFYSYLTEISGSCIHCELLNRMKKKYVLTKIHDTQK